MAMDLTGRRLLVAGDRRLVAAVAGDAAACGADVVLVAEARDQGEPSAAGHAIGDDGTAEADIEHAMDRVLERTGFDALIVMFAIEPMPPLDAAGRQPWDRGVIQPLRTTFWLVRRSVFELLAAGRGGSIAIVMARGVGEDAARSAAIVEGALVALARSVAKEYGRRAITCNVVSGGATVAALRAAAAAALFLVSPAAGFVTGECLRVDEETTGGVTADPV